MNDLINLVLLSNSSQLGFNWIYNREFLKSYSKNNEMLMTEINNKHYTENKPSYNSYKGAKIGDTSLCGNIIKWLYKDLKEKESYNEDDYKRLLLNHFMPGGLYTGYVESYGKELVLNELSKNNKFEMKDDQLVGFVPYIVYKALKLDVYDALKLTKVLTNNKDYEILYNILENVNKDNILKVVKNSNLSFKGKILNAINYNDDSFIKDIHELSCSIDVAFPIIFYLYNKHNNLLDALKENVILGGASSDRAIILATLYYPDKLKSEWNKYL